MRSILLSTKLQRVQLSDILSYGKEALANRRKDLFLIALFFVFLPDILDLVAWQVTASTAVSALAETPGKTPLELLEHLVSRGLSTLALPNVILGVIKAWGILMLARTSVDYFESRPEPLSSVALRSLIVLFRKGLGALLVLLLVIPVTSIIPFVAVITLSMLVMLPVTLVTGTKGGIRTTIDTIFLNYTTPARVGGKVPAFMNILTVAGFFLTILLGIGFLIDQLPQIDLLMQIPAGFFAKDIEIFGQTINASQLLSNFLNVTWQTLGLIVMLPFTAAMYHLQTVPEGHKDFETVV